MSAERKPLMPALARIRERRDVRRTFRLAESEDRLLQDGAVAEGLEFSEYCRECLLTGHSMRQTARLVEANRRMPLRRASVGRGGRVSDARA